MTEKDDKPTGSSRRQFMAGAATLGAFAALGDALPMLSKMAPQAGQIDPSMFKLVDYKAVDRADGSEETVTVSFTRNSKTTLLTAWARRAESESSYVVFQHLAIQMPNGQPPTRIVAAISATKGETSGDFRMDTATVTYINSDGTVKESTPRKMRIPLGPNPLEGLTPQQMFDRMLEDKASGGTPEYLPKEVR